MARSHSLLACVSLLVVTSIAGAETPAARVESFSPTGSVKAPRQVAVRFSEPIVAFGDPRPAAPFTIACSEKGVGRWLDTRRWVFDFERDVPAGVRCRFETRPDLKALSGSNVATATFEFRTGGPQVQEVDPYDGSDTIEEEQAFVLFLDAAATSTSVERHVWLSVEGIRERIGVRVLEGDESAQIAATFYPERRKRDFVIVQPKRRFPNGAKVKLVWDRGNTTGSGIANEIKQTFTYTVRQPFRVELHCSRVNAKADCIPLLPIRVEFTAPVSWEQARTLVLAVGDTTFSPKPPRDGDNLVSSIEFVGPFPESQRLELRAAAELRDDSGRTPANGADFPLVLKTDTYPPLAKFSARFGILEAEADPTLPVTVRNVEAELKLGELQLTADRDTSVGAKLRRLTDRVTGNIQRLPADRLDLIQPWLRKVGRATHDTSIFTAGVEESPTPKHDFTLPRPNGDKAFEVVGIPLKAPGLYLVEIESPRLGAALFDENKKFYVPTAALVTNLSVHFKQGSANALVWVTSLDDADPVADAEVTIQDCTGKTVWSGTTDRDGIARVAELPARGTLPSCEDEEHQSWSWSRDSHSLEGFTGGLLVIARTHEDLSFTHSTWQDGIEPWRFGVPADFWAQDDTVAHTIFDRPMYRTGETVSMKHVLRRRDLTGFRNLEPADSPTTLVIEHVGTYQKYEQPVSVDAAGIALNTWTIPADAKLGMYQVSLQRDEQHRWDAGSFRVSAFRLPLMKADVALPKAIDPGSPSAAIDLSAQYLSGGAAKQLPVTLRTQVRATDYMAPAPFDRYQFGRGPVETGVKRRGEWGDDEESKPAAAPVLQKTDAHLDDSGTTRVIASDLPAVKTPSELLAEMEFRDPNGEVQTVAATAPLWPSRWLPGIQAEDWTLIDGDISAKIAVLDSTGNVVAGAPVHVEVFRRTFFSSRKRLAGGFYGYENVTDISGPIATLCEGKTAPNGVFVCTAKAPAAGELLLQATVEDPEHHRAMTQASVWVRDEDELWFDARPGDRMDVLPERHRYEPGDTARLQVRMPFRHATALVSLEREGILDARVVKLSGKEPVVEVPIVGSFAPNVFVSVLAVRGRVSGGQPTAMLDLGKPAFRLGLAELQVGWRGHQLDVAVKPDREVYRVRERAEVEIEVRTADGRPLPADTEVAIAAIDAGLLELAPNKSWDILSALLGRRSYRVQTASAQLQVIGKRHFGLKALPSGGGGGRQSTRELFDTLLLWEPRVRLDERGHAHVSVPLNDSLTSFRIAAIATGGTNDYGTGTATIRSSQDLMILAGLAPLVREGDRIRNEVTVRNATERTLDVTVAAHADGLAAAMQDQHVTLAAGGAQIVAWDVAIPVGVAQLAYELRATAGATTDSVTAKQQVLPAVPERVFQATLVQVAAEHSETVARPSDALPGRGGVEVAVAPSLLVGLEGPREWLRDYPFSCLEQRVSVAIGRGDAESWSKLSDQIAAYVDGDGLLKYFRDNPRGSDVLTSYVLNLTETAKRPLPEAVKRNAIEALRGFVTGTLKVDSRFNDASLALRKLAAVAALGRAGAASAALLDSIPIEPQLWPDNALVDWLSVVKRIPNLRDRDARAAEIDAVLRARLSAQGTTLGFAGTDGLWQLMVSADLPTNRLIVELIDLGIWNEDMPNLMRGALGRMRQGHWDATTSNAWGVLALERFARRFETALVQGATTATLAGRTKRFDWSTSATSREAVFAWPSGEQALTVQHTGSGAPWATIRSRAAIPLRQPISAGYRIKKSIVPVQQRTPGGFSVGDVIRVHLEIEASSEMSWVVVDDPLPAGASHLAGDTLRQSRIQSGEPSDSWNGPTFEERKPEAWRAYFDWMSKGRTELDHTMRLNQSGVLRLPPTRIEAMYAPEMFAEIPNAAITVEP